jgi:hypothetical protein
MRKSEKANLVEKRRRGTTGEFFEYLILRPINLIEGLLRTWHGDHRNNSIQHTHHRAIAFVVFEDDPFLRIVDIKI